MATPHTAIPNEFTIEPKVEVSIELFDGTRIYRLMPLSEFKQWQREGGDPEDLREDDDA
jgi:hypothetical protein